MNVRQPHWWPNAFVKQDYGLAAEQNSNWAVQKASKFEVRIGRFQVGRFQLETFNWGLTVSLDSLLLKNDEKGLWMVCQRLGCKLWVDSMFDQTLMIKLWSNLDHSNWIIWLPIVIHQRWLTEALLNCTGSTAWFTCSIYLLESLVRFICSIHLLDSLARFPYSTHLTIWSN